MQLLPGATEEEIEHRKEHQGHASVTTMLERARASAVCWSWLWPVSSPISGQLPRDLQVRLRLGTCGKMIRSLGKRGRAYARRGPHCRGELPVLQQNYKVDLNELLKNWPAIDEKPADENA